MRTALIALLALSAFSMAAHANETQCHQLARHPSDPDMRFKGVAEQSVDAPAAIQACEAAVQATPDDGRLHYQLGRAYIVGNNVQKGGFHIVRAAELGYALAQYQVFEWGEQPNPPIQLTDSEKAILVQNAASAGLADARLTLAFLHFQGRYVEKNAAETIRLISGLADEGHAAGMYHYGELILGGMIKDTTQQDGLNWYGKAARAGHPQAGYKLAKFYETQNKGREALYWAKIAADTGDKNGKGLYATYLKSGVGDMRGDRAKWKEWLDGRLALADTWAMLHLAYAYNNANPPERDKALMYFTMAAEHHVYQAYPILVNMYRQQGDMQEARPWLNRIVAEGPLEDRYDAAFQLVFAGFAEDSIRAFTTINQSGDSRLLRLTLQTLADKGTSPTWFIYQQHANRLLALGNSDDAAAIAAHLMSELEKAEKALADKDGRWVVVPYELYVRDVRDYLQQIKPRLPKDIQDNVAAQKQRHDQIVKKVMGHQSTAYANVSWARRQLELLAPSEVIRRCGDRPKGNASSRWYDCAQKEAAALRKASTTIKGQIPDYRKTQAGYEAIYYRSKLQEAADTLGEFIKEPV